LSILILLSQIDLWIYYTPNSLTCQQIDNIKKRTLDARFFVMSFLYLSSTMSSRSLKSRDTHQRAQSPTTVKIILAANVAAPPQIQATISKPKSPTLPQLIPPTMSKISAILSIQIIFDSPFLLNSTI